MIDYCTITPTRGDRPELFKFCIKQLDKMAGDKPLLNAYIINEQPKSDFVDLVSRIRQGYEMAKRDGFKYIFIIEDDDYYPENYLTNLYSIAASGDYDFIGYSDTVYYNLRNKTYQIFNHKDRASLFSTGFKVSALDNFTWPNDNHVFLDIKLWEYANRSAKKIKLLENNPCLGIKHGIGKTGGKGHQMVLQNKDEDLKYLQCMVDSEAFEFYKNIMNKL
jgi:hypothetical protein